MYLNTLQSRNQMQSLLRTMTVSLIFIRTSYFQWQLVGNTIKYFFFWQFFTDHVQEMKVSTCRQRVKQNKTQNIFPLHNSSQLLFCKPIWFHVLWSTCLLGKQLYIYLSIILYILVMIAVVTVSLWQKRTRRWKLIRRGKVLPLVPVYYNLICT